MSDDAAKYHEGEIAVQERTGRRGLAETLAARISSALTDEAADLLASLPFIILAAIDDEGRPWASIAAAEEGFLAPRATKLEIRAGLSGADPLHRSLRPGVAAGLIAIDLAKRLRFRINGTVASYGEEISIAIGQCYRNCPQYIHARRSRFDAAAKERLCPRHRQMTALDEPARALVRRADTFFIASHTGPDGASAPNSGADASHRGGNPGFVRVAENGAVLTFPDYVGNFMFNTLGNLLRYPRCGLLFIDFETGDTLQVTGRVSVDWDRTRAATIPGAQRVIDLAVERAVYTEAAVPIEWTLVEHAPDLRRYGEARAFGQASPSVLPPQSAIAGFRPLEVARIVEEATGIRSLYLKSPDGAPLPAFRPGQHLPVMIGLPDGAGHLLRHYSLSDYDPAPRQYRIGVKRIGSADGMGPTGSQTLHDETFIGSTVLVGRPAGSFSVDLTRSTPIVLVSAGIGITPVLSMLLAVCSQQRGRPVIFIQGVRDGSEQAYSSEIRRLADGDDSIKTHIRFSRPRPLPLDFPGRDYDSTGRIDIGLVRSLAPLDAEFYLCGPSAFMTELRAGLLAWGVVLSRIHSEAFVSVADDLPDLGRTGAKVRFLDEVREADWPPNGRSILDLAESIGLHPAYSCRGGTCGTCEHRLVSGRTTYPVEPEYRCAAGNILICRAQPLSDIEIANPGEPNHISE